MIAAALAGVAIWSRLWILFWPVCVLLGVAIVYAVHAPRALGKRSTGSIAWWGWALWAPLFGYMRLLHELARTLTSEPVATLVADGIWVGRRPRVHELPEGIAIVVDLCAELAAAPGVAADRASGRPLDRAYLAIPTLDATSPTPEQLVRAVDRVLSTNGPAFIHCAFGHGRSATLAAAVLIRRGDATVDDVEQKMQARRPKIALNTHQRAALVKAVALAASRAQ